MKVLLISEYFPPIVHGGGEISAYALANELAKNKIEVHVLTSHFRSLKKYEEKNNIKIHRLLKTGITPSRIIDNAKRILFFHKSIKKQVPMLHKKEKFDIIHFLNTHSITNLSNIKVPKIATINGYTNFCPKANLYYKKVKFLPGEKNFIKYLGDILTSDYIGKQKFRFYLKYNPIFIIWLYLDYINRRNQLKYVDKFILLNDVIKLRNSKKIYNILDINQSTINYPLTTNEQDVVITYIGKLEQIKGVDILIKAFSKANGAKLLIIGSGSEEKNLKKLCEELNVQDKVIFTGKIDQKYMPCIYSKTQIIALPTRWPEPLSRTLLEALFFSKPIIATRKGGNIEQVKDNINGFLIETEEELAEKLNLLINNKNLRESMGKKSKELYKERFDPKKLIKQIIEFYQ